MLICSEISANSKIFENRGHRSPPLGPWHYHEFIWGKSDVSEISPYSPLIYVYKQTINIYSIFTVWAFYYISRLLEMFYFLIIFFSWNSVNNFNKTWACETQCPTRVKVTRMSLSMSSETAWPNEITYQIWIIPCTAQRLQEKICLKKDILTYLKYGSRQGQSTIQMPNRLTVNNFFCFQYYACNMNNAPNCTKTQTYIYLKTIKHIFISIWSEPCMLLY